MQALRWCITVAAFVGAAAAVSTTRATRTHAQEFSILAQEFDARGLSLAEKRVLQIGLTVGGTYVGLIDGLWGNGSQSALERLAAAHDPSAAAEGLVYNYNVAALAGAAAQFISENGLEYRGGPPYGHRLLVPPGAFTEYLESDLDDVVLYSRGLQVRVFRSHVVFAVKLHVALAEGIQPFEEPYLVRATNRLVTAQGAGAARVYARSDPAPDGEGWYTTAVSEVEVADHSLFNVVVAGISLDGGANIHIGGGWLEGLSQAAIEYARTPPPTEPPPPPPEPPVADGDAPTSFGTAFFVNNTDLVTAKHVIEGCESVAFVDGTKLSVFAEHPTLDLALLSSPARSRTWIPVHMTGEAKLGQRINVLGYPYFGMTGTSLSMTAGNISALLGLGDDPREITISAPVQPGNSGGPLLSRDGAVIGVVVSRLNKLVVAEATGSLPENINFAVTGKELLAFLEDQSVSLPRTGEEKIDLDEGIPDSMQAAVVPVICSE